MKTLEQLFDEIAKQDQIILQAQLEIRHILPELYKMALKTMDGTEQSWDEYFGYTFLLMPDGSIVSDDDHCNLEWYDKDSIVDDEPWGEEVYEYFFPSPVAEAE
ncbi:MAG: hypothetical protein WA532_11460 [Candidatus Korobacteraceae bacterium]